MDDEYQSQLLETPMRGSYRPMAKTQTGGYNKFPGANRPKTSSYLRRGLKNNPESSQAAMANKPKHIIQQCTVPPHLMFEKQREQIVSNLPSARKMENIENTQTFDEKQVIMSLYKIKSKH